MKQKKSNFDLTDHLDEVVSDAGQNQKPKGSKCPSRLTSHRKHLLGDDKSDCDRNYNNEDDAVFNGQKSMVPSTTRNKSRRNQESDD